MNIYKKIRPILRMPIFKKLRKIDYPCQIPRNLKTISYPLPIFTNQVFLIKI
jgi:hypothetical protein